MDQLILRTAAVPRPFLDSVVRVSPASDVGQVLAAAESASVDGAPVLDGSPTGSGQVLTATDGTPWFVPVAVLPKMSSTSSTPNVFFDDPGGTWVLRVAIDLVRPEGVPEAALPLPVDGLSVALSSSTSVTLADVVEAPPPDASVVRRVIASGPVDRDAVVSALDGVPTSTFSVTGTVHWRVPEVVPGPTWSPGIVRADARLQVLRLAPLLAAGTVVEDEPAQVRDRRLLRVRDRLRLPPVVVDRPVERPRGSSPASQPLALTVGGAPLSAYFPKSTPAYRRIYARALTGVAGDPDAVWVPQGGGFWREAVAPGEFYTTPQEYRLAIEEETGLPAMSVLLVSTPRPDGRVDYRVRVRFVVAPWLDPRLTAATRAGIEQHEGLTYPRLVVGGVESARFSASGLLNQLGASILSGGSTGAPDPSGPTAEGAGPGAAPGAGTTAGTSGAGGLTSAVDPAGFELVFDCTLEFYTLLGNLMTGKAGVVPGVEGEVALSLRTGDGPQDTRQVRVPVHLRLDRWAGTVVSVEPLAPGDGVPARAGGVTVGVRNHAAYPVTVGSMLATLVASAGEPPVPLDTAPGRCEPAALSLPPRADDAPPLPVVLTPTDDLPAAAVDTVDLTFVDVAVQVEPAAALARIHELVTSGSITTTVKVRSYLLQHPETLPPAVADVFGLEVQVERGSGTPLTVVITRDEPEKTTDVAFSFTDLLAGIRPDSPELRVRRRNLVPTGASGWGAWESVVGREIFLSPVLPEVPAPGPTAPDPAEGAHP